MSASKKLAMEISIFTFENKLMFTSSAPASRISPVKNGKNRIKSRILIIRDPRSFSGGMKYKNIPNGNSTTPMLAIRYTAAKSTIVIIKIIKYTIPSIISRETFNTLSIVNKKNVGSIRLIIPVVSPLANCAIKE